MSFGRCTGPIWSYDDFSSCFQHDYLQTLLPLLICAISLTTLAWSTWISTTSKGYHKLGHDDDNKFHTPNGHHQRYFDAPNGHVENGTAASRPKEEKTARVHDYKTQSVETVSRPTAMLATTCSEALLSSAVLAVSIVFLVTRIMGTSTLVLSIANVAVWSYVTGLVYIRLYATFTGHDSQQSLGTHLWYHTAALYPSLWTCLVMVFRSEVIYPHSSLSLALLSLHFAANTILTLIAVCSRPGNATVILYSEPGLQPSREPAASILSTLTFWWLVPLMRTGLERTLEADDVWDNPPAYKSANITDDYARESRKGRLSWHLVKQCKRPIILSCLWSVLYAVTYFVPALLLKVVLQYLEDPVNRPINTAWLAATLTVVNGIMSAIGQSQAMWNGRRVSAMVMAILYNEVYQKSLRRKIGGAKQKVLGKAKQDKPILDPQLPNAAEDGAGTDQEIEWDEPGMLGMWAFCVSWPFPSFWPFKAAKSDSGQHDDDDAAAVAQRAEDDGAQASAGAVTSLMSSDLTTIQGALAYLSDVLVVAPLQLIFCIGFLFYTLGSIVFVTLGVIGFMALLQYIVLREYVRLERKVAGAEDARIEQASEMVRNMRIVKLFAWEERFLALVEKKRSLELRFRLRRDYMQIVAFCVTVSAPTAIAAVTFLFFTVVTGHDMPPSVAFPALSIITLLQTPLNILSDMINYLQMAYVSVSRVEEFLEEGESPKSAQLETARDPETGESMIGFSNASFSWGTKGDDDFKMFDLDINFGPGINLVLGPLGSGKSSMLAALLGEMKKTSGRVFLPQLDYYDTPRPDPKTGLTETVAFCAQTPWLINSTVKQNIIFASDWDEVRYNQVIDACSLTRDVSIWKKGHDTPLGENGINISGGQKQRISLARALYSRAKYLLLDDVLSAVDSHTSKHIVEEALQGPLLGNRTCIIVTHNTALLLPISTFAVALRNGRIVAQGSPDEVIQRAGLSADESGSRAQTRPSSKAPSIVTKTSQVDLAQTIVDDKSPLDGSIVIDESGPLAKHSTPSEVIKTDKVVDVPGSTTEIDSDDVEPSAQADPAEDLDETGLDKETKAAGSIKLRVLWQYFQACGAIAFVVPLFVAMTARYAINVAQMSWIRIWSNQFSSPRESAFSVRSSLFHAGNYPHMAAPEHLQMFSVPQLSMSIEPSTIEEVDGAYYIGIYALLGLGFAILSAGQNLVVVLGALRASKTLHRQLLESLAFVKFRFYDITPIGRIINRFTNDLSDADESAPVTLHLFFDCIFKACTTLAVIAYILPKFLIGGVLLVFMYLAVAKFYVGAARDLKRISSVSRSPILQLFSETLAGTVTIRAYGHQQRFVLACRSKADGYLRPYLMNWASNRWLAMMSDIISTGVAFATIVVVVMGGDYLDAGTAGLAITYAFNFSGTLIFLIRFYASLEQDMNAVERIDEYCNVGREAPPIVEEYRAPANWPNKGAIEFKGYSTKYAEGLDYALKNLTFEVPSAAKVGVIGRTGAGKSSLALALFRALEADRGSIIVDGIDISKIGLHDLREGVLSVPQDPTLFSGTLRSNLDPFSLFTDEEIMDALRKVHLIGSEDDVKQLAKTAALLGQAKVEPVVATRTGEASSASDAAVHENKNLFYNLKTKVADGGTNFSQGQRQLLCLARALLKSPKILLMDEATASIDYATDVKIQACLREFKHTFITIAHRLRTIIDYDKILVLDQGEVQEYGHPYELITKDDSQFRSMCEATGQLDELIDMAEQAWRSRDTTLLD